MSSEQTDARMVADFMEHLDPLHQECEEARAEIREKFRRRKAISAAWIPAPCPPSTSRRRYIRKKK